VLILGRLDLAAQSAGQLLREGYEAHIARDDGQWLRPLLRGWKPDLVLLHPEFPGDWLDAGADGASGLIPPQLAGLPLLVVLDQSDLDAAPGSHLPEVIDCASTDGLARAAAKVLGAAERSRAPWTAGMVGARPAPLDEQPAAAGDDGPPPAIERSPSEGEQPFVLYRVPSWSLESRVVAAVRADGTRWAVIEGPAGADGREYRILLDGGRYAVARSVAGAREQIVAADALARAVRLHEWRAR
jgi:hypothetical protein